MACGNNHVSRAGLRAGPSPAEKVVEAARAELARIARQIEETHDREATATERARADRLGVAARLAKFHAEFDPANLAPPGAVQPSVQDEPGASDFNFRTGKMNVYTGPDGMPRYGNVYPHVHYFENPETDEIGATASVVDENGNKHHVGGSLFSARQSGRSVANQLTILRQAIADRGISPASVEARVEELKRALELSGRE